MRVMMGCFDFNFVDNAYGRQFNASVRVKMGEWREAGTSSAI